ncbi:MAG: hypothetical protein KGY69_17600 [Bacteroidales bacterium]|nr:hypothetical protein [Bacteroidales bacterium]
MGQYIFQGDYENKSGIVKIKLILFHFVDEGNVHFIYSPHLDLTGYGYTLEEAKKSFKITFTDFVDYTLNKNTLGNVLKQLGWQIKGKEKKPKKVLAPSIGSVIRKNDYVSEIMDKYQVNTFHENVCLPVN